MFNPEFEIILITSICAAACALPGVFLVLRKVALMSDAISHAILLGIVLAFFITKDLSSPLLVVAAALTGILTVSLTEAIIQTQKLKKDAAIGLVFPLLFSIGVILINRNAGDVHLDADCVLFGEVAFLPFDRLVVHNIDFGPKGLWIVLGTFLLNAFFIVLFYKELKIATFDVGLAASLGFLPGLVNYLLMTIVSITAVSSFQIVGSILVVALMITPPASAYLLTNRLSHMIFISVFLGIASSVGGYFMAYRLDASIAGSMASFSGILFFLTLIFAPEKGLLAKFIVKKFKKWNFASETLAVHLLQAEYAHAEDAERVVSHMNDHMLWGNDFTSEVIAQSLEEGLIKKSGNKLSLTALGREKAKNIISKN
ncbi:MAG: metal ABC transporter permease [Candidatus Omnitrophica bacterium]|nr:metal ABC transporter permease [Candidatus Omnitrophota bacterium]